MIERDLRDADVGTISDDRRFEAAFNAALTAATIALRACGYRTSSQSGHHIKTIESLELTLNAESKLIRRLKAFSTKRNYIIYESAGVVSAQDLESVIRTVLELKHEVTEWCRKHHPDLLSG